MSNNTAFQSGEAISCEQGEIILDEGMIRGNTATENGGALSAEQCDLTIDNVLFIKNIALNHGGGLYSNLHLQIFITVKGLKIQLVVQEVLFL